MGGEAQTKASVKFNRTRDSITIRPDKETGAKIRQSAKDAEMTVTEYILTAVKAYMNK